MEIAAIIGICVFVSFGLGYRLGYQRGLATWRRSYIRMTPRDIAEHKNIINKMPAAR
jgi:hypothetical protein